MAARAHIEAKRVVVITDACHAAGVGQIFDIEVRGDRAVGVNPINQALSRLAESVEGVCVLNAAGEGQYSQESADWGGGHGVFTYTLLRGLKGQADYSKDGEVTLGELIPYLSQTVRRETKNAQSPSVSGRFDPALSIAAE